MKQFTSLLLLASFVAVNAQARPQLQQMDMSQVKRAIPYMIQRVDKNMNPIGRRVILPTGDLGIAGAPTWSPIFDMTNGGVGTGGTPVSNLNTYGPGAFYTFGGTYKNPFCTNDMVTVRAGSSRTIATAFTSIALLSVTQSSNISLFVNVAGTFKNGGDVDATENLGGVIISFLPLSAAGFYIVDSGDFGQFGVGIPTAGNGAAVNYTILESPDQTFSTFAIPSFPCEPGLAQPLFPTESINPGTNPFMSTGFQWDDDTPSDFVHIAAEYYDYVPFGVGTLQAANGLWDNSGSQYITGNIGFSDLADPARAERLEVLVNLVAVDAGGTPLRDLDGNVIFDSQLVLPEANGDYRLLHPKLTDSSNVPVDRYRLSFSNYHWLRANTGVVTFTGGSVSGVDVTLINGDVDGDGEVGGNDLSILSSSFLTAWDGTGDIEAAWLNTPAGAADLDEDGEIGSSDLSILSTNFLLSGDEDITL